ncbi:MAG: hypothetical protein ACI90V_002508, partial [Bacillariaceae sp.]
PSFAVYEIVEIENEKMFRFFRRVRTSSVLLVKYDPMSY